MESQVKYEESGKIVGPGDLETTMNPYIHSKSFNTDLTVTGKLCYLENLDHVETDCPWNPAFIQYIFVIPESSVASNILKDWVDLYNVQGLIIVSDNNIKTKFTGNSLQLISIITELRGNIIKELVQSNLDLHAKIVHKTTALCKILDHSSHSLPPHTSNSTALPSPVTL